MLNKKLQTDYWNEILLMKLEDSEDEHQVYGRIVGIKSLLMLLGVNTTKMPDQLDCLDMAQKHYWSNKVPRVSGSNNLFNSTHISLYLSSVGSVDLNFSLTRLHNITKYFPSAFSVNLLVNYWILSFVRLQHSSLALELLSSFVVSLLVDSFIQLLYIIVLQLIPDLSPVFCS
ncbi:hypothetical protein Tco_0415648 [Tanacetum coccineum]